ncbi:hypothetical protein POKO110462_18365 [Pontibacter korlensis]|uniref:Uncharacterized protein n=1 Tax=Pontibacter korlensis TaxID=400092 RepID=A0A0E3ZEK3_9BACT|nr:hypothetical protein PKOR_03385 [Pontibacter korlensis]
MRSNNAKGELQESKVGWFVASLVHGLKGFFNAVGLACLDQKNPSSVFSRQLLATPSKAIHLELGAVIHNCYL